MDVKCNVQYTIRELRLQDIDEVHNIHMQLFPVNYPRSFIVQFLDKNKFLLELVENGPAGEKIIGVSGVKISWSNFWSTERKAYFSTFGILPDRQKIHLGKDLMAATVYYLFTHYKIRNLSLHVQASNESARKFYTKLGWVGKQFLPSYYKKLDSPDAFFMTYNTPIEYKPVFEHNITYDQKTLQKIMHPQRFNWFTSFCLF